MCSSRVPPRPASSTPAISGQMLQQRTAMLIAHRQPIGLPGECSTSAARAVTEQPTHRQADQHQAATDGDIGQRAGIAAVHPR
jgi:hypothetical protein